MTSSFSLSTKTIFAGGRSRHQFGVFPGIGFEACGEVGHDWDPVSSLILIVDIA